MIRRLAATIAAVLLIAGCGPGSGDTAEPSTTAPPTTAGISTTTPVTATSTAVAPTGTVADEDLFGVGDSKYPELGNQGYEVDHYTIDLTYDPDAGTINSFVTIDATATRNVQALSLDFVGFDVTAVQVDGADADYVRRNDKLIVQTGTVIPSGEGFSVTVAYNGVPSPIQSQALPFPIGWLTDPNGTVYVVSEPDGTRSWMPANDHPSDKASYTFRITVPDGLIAAANGVHVDTITDLGSATWVWEETAPMATYLATIVIGNLKITDDPASTARSGVQVRNVLPDGLSAGTLEKLGLQGEMIEFLSGKYGPYPFDSYGLAVVDDFDAALENQTLSVFGRYMVDTPGYFETVMVHELGHQWYGDSVTPADWGDVWLNEGFATYTEWLWLEHTKGENAMLNTIAGQRDHEAAGNVPPPGNPPANDLFNESVYIRGGLVLQALRTEVGDEKFFEILRDWANTYRGKSATTDDFISLAEADSGRDLTGLFNDWLYSEQVPPLP
jgi:aminopeptidase N